MSWNALQTSVTERAVVAAMREFVPPRGVVLIDDGWMGAGNGWGDWKP
jgi:hypothetical protein